MSVCTRRGTGIYDYASRCVGLKVGTWCDPIARPSGVLPHPTLYRCHYHTEFCLNPESGRVLQLEYNACIPNHPLTSIPNVTPELSKVRRCRLKSVPCMRRECCSKCRVRTVRCAFSGRNLHEDAIGSHACSLECSLEANMRVTNGIPLGSPLALIVAIINHAETLKGK
jgi:hypothetical protein